MIWMSFLQVDIYAPKPYLKWKEHVCYILLACLEQYAFQMWSWSIFNLRNVLQDYYYVNGPWLLWSWTSWVWMSPTFFEIFTCKHHRLYVTVNNWFVKCHFLKYSCCKQLSYRQNLSDKFKLSSNIHDFFLVFWNFSQNFIIC